MVEQSQDWGFSWDFYQSPQRDERMVYNWIQLQHSYSRPETDLITSDVTRAFLNKGGLSVVRRLTILTNTLKSLRMYRSALIVKNIVGAYAVATLGLGNYATLIAQSAFSFKQFLRPEDYEEDLITSLMKKMSAVKGKVGGIRP